MDSIVGTNTSTTSWNEVDELIVVLRAWGIHYLVGKEQTADTPDYSRDQQSAVVLLQRLVQCHDYPQVRDAIISLLLLHPELASAVQQCLRESATEIAAQIETLTLATLYLQRLWSIRLALALGHLPDFSEQPFAHLWQSKRLPAPSCHVGAYGLIALQAYEQKRTGLPFTFVGDWQNQVDHLLWQEEHKHHPPIKNLLPLLALLNEAQQEEEESAMSMRPDVDKALP